MGKRTHFSAPLRLRVRSLFSVERLIGASPGTLEVSESAPKPRIRVIQYDRDKVSDAVIDDLDALDRIDTSKGITWVDVQGLGHEPTLRRIAKRFEIHPLALEDMVNVPQRPKIEPYGEHLLWVTRMVKIDAKGVIDREQVSLYQGPSVVVSFQQRPGDVFDAVRKRIGDATSRLRRSQTDYLVYAILDTVIDGYYPVVERINQGVEDLEARIMVNANPDHLAAINQTRALATTLKRNIQNQKLALRSFLAAPTSHVNDETLVYFKDTLDHIAQLSDVMDNQRELVAGLLNTYLSMVSYRANEVMKVLTIMASIFIPLTFIAGIYGMNFQNMPELGKAWGYPVALSVMFLVALGMVFYFVRKGWIGQERDRGTPLLQEVDEGPTKGERED